MTAVSGLYDNVDAREVPAYSYADASRYLKIPYTTLHWWVKGRPREGYEAVLSVANDQGLTFLELVEIHALKSLREQSEVKLPEIRRAVSYAENKLKIEHLLLRQDLRQFGGDLFIEYLGDLVSLSRGGQLALESILHSYLRRIEWGDDDVPFRLFPHFPGVEEREEHRPVELNPRISFGRPIVTGTGIRTGVLTYRYDAGESIDTLAEEYEIDPELVESAVLYEKAA